MTSATATPTASASLSAALGAQKAYGAHPAAKATSKLDAAAQDFEAVFLTQMMQQMFAGLGDEGPMAGGAWRSMLADEYGKTVSASGGVGISDQVRQELIAIQQGN